MKKRNIIPFLFFLLILSPQIFAEVSASLEIGDELKGEYTETNVSTYVNETYAKAEVGFGFGPVTVVPWIKGLFQVEDNEMTAFFYSGLDLDFALSEPFNIYLNGEYYADIKLPEHTEDEITPTLGFYGKLGPLEYDLSGAAEITFQGDVQVDIESALSIDMEFPAQGYSWNIGLSYEMDADLGLTESNNDEEIESVITASLETPFSIGFAPSIGGEYKSVYSSAISGNTIDLLSFFVGLGYSKGVWSLGLIWQHGYDFRTSQQKGKYVVTLEINL